MLKPDVYTVEYLVKMSCNSCVRQIERLLSNNTMIFSFRINLENQQVCITTDKPIANITSLLKQSNKSVILRGITTSSSKMIEQDFGSGVCIFYNQLLVVGVCRIYQLTDEKCYFNGMVSNLDKNKAYQICVHEYGDLSNGPQSCGDIFESEQTLEKIGFLGTILSNDSGQCVINISNESNKLWNLIGRSLVIHSVEPEARIFCGIIARSSGAFQNEKLVCTCDGLTVWEEKDLSLVHE